jgi:opacity protein-like surface antigen
MVRIVLATMMALAAAPAAWAQEEVRVDFKDPVILHTMAESLDRDRFGPEFGIRAGYIKPRDADEGTWFGGVQLRIPLATSLAIEGSIEFHSSDFDDGDVEVVQYPVQLTLLFYLFPDSPFCPYLLGGFGWYYTRVSFDDEFGNSEDDTDNFFGGHLGVGVRFGIGKSLVLNVDVRYIFAEPNEEELEEEDFDSIQLVLALSFPF